MAKNILIKLLPLVILYFLIFGFLADKSLEWGDQSRYVMYAENLTKGFYAPHDTLLLWNGPWYPLLLTPFAYFKIPWIYAKALNPIFMFLAVCFIYMTLKQYMSEKWALFFSYLFGLYPPFYAEIRYLLTEPFTLMLMSAFALFTVKWFNTFKYRFMLLAAVFCAFITLTKIFFAYVSLTVLVMAVIFSGWSITCRRSVAIYAIGLLLCVPYLFYTYTLTGKVFYWANSGGLVVYWMSNPYSNEFGDVRTDEEVARRPELVRHKEFFDKLKGLNYVQQDELMKKQAIENIGNHPGKIVLNLASNVCRLFFNFPYSYKYQHPRTLFYMVPGSLLLGAMILCVYPLIKLRRRLPSAIIHSCGLSVIFMAGQSLLYAEARYLCPIVPFVLIVIAYTATNLVKVEPLRGQMSFRDERTE